jgi:sugar diacid utilization regulator
LAAGAVAVAGTLQDPHNQGRRITDERLVKRFLQRGRSVISMNRSGALLDWRDGGLLILLPPARPVKHGEEGTANAEALALGERLMNATVQAVPGLALTLAFSRFTREPSRLGMAIEEARLAHSIGEKLGRVGQLVTFEETGAYKLLFRVLADRPDEIRSFFEETVEPVLAYDDDHQTDLTATLSIYLENDGNLAATAAQLFTHRHTVRYRLDRIRDVTGLDVGKSEDREMLSLGLKAMRLLGYPSPSSTVSSSVGEEQAAG